MRELNNGLVQPRDDVVAAIILTIHQQDYNAGMLHEDLRQIAAELRDIRNALENYG